MTGSHVAWGLAMAGGAAVGVVYFSGLWWTVRRATRSPRPAVLIAGSFLVRGIVAAALLVWLAAGDPWRLLGAVGAFLAVRAVGVRIARATTPAGLQPRPSPEGG